MTCSSVGLDDHTYLDTDEPTYVAHSGETRQWQRCTGCGNVRNRLVKTFNQVKMPFFRRHFESARHESETIREATSPFESGRRGTRYFLWSDGFQSAGYAIRADGELVYVHSTKRGMGDTIVADAIRNGATHLDCFDGYLVDFYARNGFEIVRSEPNWFPTGPRVVYLQVVTA